MNKIALLILVFCTLLSGRLFAHSGADVSHAADDAYWADLAKNYPVFMPLRRDSYSKHSDDVAKIGQWSTVIDWPHIPVSASNLPDGRVITWSSNQKTSFPRGTEFTYSSTWHPLTQQFIETNNTYQDMFAAHLSLLEDGRLFISGGNNRVKTSSVFDFKSNQCERLEDMHRGRWYPTNVALPSGEIFSALGSSGGRYPELWNEKTGWKVLTGVDLTRPILQYENYYEREWWPLLHIAPLGYIFHSGPTPQMHNISTKNLGSIRQVGPENRRWYPKHGITILYNEGKLLVAGGAISGLDQTSSNQTMLIDINTTIPKVSSTAPMLYPRKFHNGVMLPTGEVLVIGGNTSGIKFADKGSVLPTEIWNPQTKKWREGAEISVPRNYHSIALLLPDGNVLSAGGGLCNCSADHQDAQLYSPSYLFNEDGSLAERPNITMGLNEIKLGQQFTLSSDADISKFSMVKMSSTTHGVNTDLRYLEPTFSPLGVGRYRLTAHANKNILTPGYWMLFAINQQGVPSVAKIIRIIVKGTATIKQPNAQAYLLGSVVSLQMAVKNGNHGQFSAKNLPQGLVIDTKTGLISGEVKKSGLYRSKINYSEQNEQSEILLIWNIYTRGKIEGVSYETYQGSWDLLPDFTILSKQAEIVTQGVIKTFTLPNASFISQDALQPFVTRLSARIIIDKRDNYQFYLASVNGSRLFIDGQLLIDNDGQHALNERSNSIKLAQGEHNIIVEYIVNGNTPQLNLFYSSAMLEKQAISNGLLLQNPLKNIAPILNSIESQSSIQGDFIRLNIIANDANGDPLVFSALGLPDGLSINSHTGVISGAPSKIATYNTTIEVHDPLNKKAVKTLRWNITGIFSITPIIKPPKPVGKLINYFVGTNITKDVQYQWDFGDGSNKSTYATNNSSKHKYSNAGNYIITVTAKDGDNNKVSEQFSQTIYNPHNNGKPQASSSIVYASALGVGHIWNVNPDNNSVSGFNTSTLAKITEIAVGKNPRALAFAPDGTLWVTNKGSFSVSIIDTEQQAVIETLKLPYASQPYGLVFSKRDNMAYIILEASGLLVKIDVTTRSIIATLVLGENPRHISISAAEDLLYIPRYISPMLPDENTIEPKTEKDGVHYGGEILLVKTNDFTLINSLVLQHSPQVDSEKNARGIPNYLGAVALSPDGHSAWIPSKQDNIKRGKNRDGQVLTFDNTVRSISSKINVDTGKEELSARIDHDNAGIASAAIFGKYGSYLFVALEGSREIEVLDAYSYEALFRVKTERAPQGLALSEDGLSLFSHNFMDRSITVYDIYNLLYGRSNKVSLIARLKTVDQETLSATVLRGKQLFYDSFDPRLAKEQYSSCASCHNQGHSDGRTWDMSDSGEGLRNTISLLGHGGMDQGRLHWSGNFDEVQDFEGQIRALSGGTGLMQDADFHYQTRSSTLGTPKAGISQSLDDLANYVASLKETPASPYRSKNNPLSETANRGKTLFENKGCIDCHSGEQFTDSALNVRHNIGSIKATSGKRLNAVLDGLDTPTLLGVWQTAPYLHDGSAKTLEEAIQAHDSASNLTHDSIIHLANYLKQLDNDAKENFKNPSIAVPPPIKAAAGAVFISLLFLLFSIITLFRKLLRQRHKRTINLT